MIVDVHAHYFPDAYFSRTSSLGGSYLNRFTGRVQSENLAERFGMMDDAGVARQILSPTTAPYSADEKTGTAAAALVNDSLAAIANGHPDRLSLWISLPLPHVTASLTELRRGLDELGGVGVVLGCFCLDQSLADQRFTPIFEELNERGSTVFLHPCQNGVCSPLVNDWGLTVCTGASLEDGLVVMHLIAKRIPARFPKIRFIVPHFGGMLPMLLNRLDGQMPQADLPEKPSVTARRFFYDTVGWGSKAALLCALEAFGDSQLVTGSDFPILLHHETYKQTFDNLRDSGVAPAVLERILNNAANLLGFGRTGS